MWWLILAVLLLVFGFELLCALVEIAKAIGHDLRRLRDWIMRR
jgi:Sec-independent protein translocase protein TatA